MIILLFLIAGIFLPRRPLLAQENGAPAPQAAGGVPPAPSRFQVIRSISGTKGTTKAGEYVIEDPRTVFYLPQDRKVIVYFEWNGPLGKHHFEALWKDPAGKVSAISDFDYEATANPFAGYWTLALADDAPTGMWSLEARVDGEVTGSHAFQVVAAPRPENLPVERVPAAPAEIYEKAGAASVFVQRLGPNGEQLGSASGFLIGEGEAVTAFQAIDGATTLRVVFHDGRRVTIDSVAAWDRRADWAVLQFSADSLPYLRRAKPESWSVGDTCYALDSPSEGNRTLAAGVVTGKSSATAPQTASTLHISVGTQLDRRFSIAMAT